MQTLFLVNPMSIGAYLEQPIFKTAGGTIQLDGPSESGSLIVVAGTGATTLRLPPLVSSEQDHRFTILNTTDQNLTIVPPSTAGYVGASLTLGTFNNLAAVSFAFTTSGNKIGAVATARSINGKWWIINDSQATATIS